MAWELMIALTLTGWPLAAKSLDPGWLVWPAKLRAEVVCPLI
jgi:hypothetical protein